MAISTHPMNDQSGKLTEAQKRSTEAGRLEALRQQIRASGLTHHIKKSEAIDRAADRLERMVDKRMERTTQQRTQAHLRTDELSRQPTPAPRPWFESGNRANALPMTPQELEKAQARAVHNVNLQNLRARQMTTATTTKLRTAKFEVIAQAVEREQRAKEAQPRVDLVPREQFKAAAETQRSRPPRLTREQFRAAARNQTRDQGLGD